MYQAGNNEPPLLQEPSDKKLDLQGKKEGKVIANDDPEGEGRVKVEIPGITKGLPVDAMPWYSVMGPVFLGGSQYSGQIGVPQLNTQVFVEFLDQNSVNSGLVVGCPINKVTFPQDNLDLTKEYDHPQTSEHHFTKDWDKADSSQPRKRFSPDFSEDYPMSHGWVDNALNFFRVNLIKRTMEFVANNFFKFKTYGDGNTIIHFPKNVKLIIEGDLLVEVRGSVDNVVYNHLYQHILGKKVEMVEQTSSVEAKKGLSQQGKTINLN